MYEVITKTGKVYSGYDRARYRKKFELWFFSREDGTGLAIAASKIREIQEY
jgi:hypothetical protein